MKKNDKVRVIDATNVDKGVLTVDVSKDIPKIKRDIESKKPKKAKAKGKGKKVKANVKDTNIKVTDTKVNIPKLVSEDGYTPKVKASAKGLDSKIYRDRASRVVRDLKKRDLGDFLEETLGDINIHRKVESWQDLENLKYNAAIIRHNESVYVDQYREKITDKLVNQLKDLSDKYGSGVLKSFGGEVNPLKYYGIPSDTSELSPKNLTKSLDNLSYKELKDINGKIDEKSMVELSKDKVNDTIIAVFKDRYFKNVRGIEVTEYSKYMKDIPTQKDVISVDKVIDEHLEDIIEMLDGNIAEMKQFISYVTDPSFTGNYDSDDEKKKNPEKYAQDVLQRISDMKLALSSGDYKKGW